MTETEAEKRLAELRKELDEANRMAQFYLEVNDTRAAEYDRCIKDRADLRKELANCKSACEDAQRSFNRIDSLYRKTEHVKWPMLMFTWGQRVEVWRTGRRDDPNGQFFAGWWPARIVGCECRQLSTLQGSHVLYEVELDGRDGTLMRLPNEIRAIQSAEAPAQ